MGTMLAKGVKQQAGKMYIILFTCPVSQAIHLEIVDNQSCQSFLLAYHNCRSICLILNFLAVHSHQSTMVQSYLGNIISLVKACLKKVLGQVLVSVELSCISVEQETIIKNRSLCYNPGDFNQFEILTPNHLLYGRKMHTFSKEITS